MRIINKITKSSIVACVALILCAHIAGCGDDSNSLTPSDIRPLEMVPIAEGLFTMGCLSGNSSSFGFEYPTHTIQISQTFLMSTTEITRYQYASIMGSAKPVGIANNCPEYNVTWYDAIRFCNALSIYEGRDTCYIGDYTDPECDFSANGYRLPTEAEWEFACRAGSTKDYHTGNLTNRGSYPLDPALDRAGWYFGNGSGGARVVAQKEPNAHGLYDMHGNVSEWCWDRWDNEYYRHSPSIDPHGPDSGYLRVVRGGSWFDKAFQCTASYRNNGSPDYSTDIGIRVVRKP